MRIFATTLSALTFVLGTMTAEAARPQPMARANAVLGKALGLSAGRIQIKAAHPLRPKEQLVSFSVVVPSIFSNAGVAYVGTALLREGRNGKAQSARVGSLEFHGTGVFSGLYEQVQGQLPKAPEAAAALVKKALRTKARPRRRGKYTPWGTPIK